MFFFPGRMRIPREGAGSSSGAEVGGRHDGRVLLGAALAELGAHDGERLSEDGEGGEDAGSSGLGKERLRRLVYIDVRSTDGKAAE